MSNEPKPPGPFDADAASSEGFWDSALDALEPQDGGDVSRDKTSIAVMARRSGIGPPVQAPKDNVSIGTTPVAPLAGPYRMFLEFDEGFPHAEVTKTVTVLGRVAGVAEVALPGDDVSRQHAALLVSGGALYIEDLASANGTFVNGHQVKRAKLSATDRIRIGKYHFCVRVTPR